MPGCVRDSDRELRSRAGGCRLRGRHGLPGHTRQLRCRHHAVGVSALQGGRLRRGERRNGHLRAYRSVHLRVPNARQQEADHPERRSVRKYDHQLHRVRHSPRRHRCGRGVLGRRGCDPRGPRTGGGEHPRDGQGPGASGLPQGAWRLLGRLASAHLVQNR